MQQLSGQDASFLYLETPNAPMHIGAVTIYDQSTVPGGVQGFKAILGTIEARLHRARTFRQRLQRVPLGLDHPYWREDPDFDLEFHVRHIALPEPGDWRQLCIQVARLHARPLDTSRPLWEFTVIEGLDDVEGLPPGCYAVVSKVHHAAIDGVSGVDITEALHDLVPSGAPVPPPTRPWRGEPAPSVAGLIGRTWWNRVRSPLSAADVAVRSVPALARVAGGFLGGELRRAGPVPRTRFDAPVGPHRVVDGRVLDLAEIRALRRAVDGATVNDVVLAVIGGALRRYLGAHGELPEDSLVAMAPVSVRDGAGRGALGNQVAAMNVVLGTHLPDDLQRLHHVAGSARRSKALTNAIGARLMTDYTRFVPSTVAGLAARLYSRLSLANRHRPLFNCVVTNVPGPQVPLYSAGARMVTQFGLGPLFDGAGLIFPVFSYAGHLTIAFTADRDAVPDPERLADAITESFEALRAAAAGAEPRDPRFGEALARAARRVAELGESLGHDDLVAGSATAAVDAAPVRADAATPPSPALAASAPATADPAPMPPAARSARAAPGLRLPPRPLRPRRARRGAAPVRRRSMPARVPRGRARPRRDGHRGPRRRVAGTPRPFQPGGPGRRRPRP
jgi:WS/DGAT/MGAT family acyltransferase